MLSEGSNSCLRVHIVIIIIMGRSLVEDAGEHGAQLVRLAAKVVAVILLLLLVQQVVLLAQLRPSARPPRPWR
eukprot:3345088-Pyramimonas_sp.AAC.1